MMEAIAGVYLLRVPLNLLIRPTCDYELRPNILFKRQYLKAVSWDPPCLVLELHWMLPLLLEPISKEVWYSQALIRVILKIGHGEAYVYGKPLAPPYPIPS